MLDQVKSLTASDFFFWFCALAGSGLFFIQFLLILLGMGDQDDLDDGADLDAGRVKWLSKQAVTGFLMMFGWAALTCEKQFGLSKIATISVALVAGFFTVFITGFIFKNACKLRSSGSVFTLEDAIGKEAMVYQRIPKGGVGKISLSLNQMTHEIDAVALSEEELSSFSTVQIIKKMDDRTVVVVPIKNR